MDLADLKEIIVLLALISIMGAAAAIALTDFQAEIDRPSGRVQNESDAVNLLWGNFTNMTLDYDEVTITWIRMCDNFTLGGDVNAGNYTVYSDAGKIGCHFNYTTDLLTGEAMCVNYTFIADNSAYNITKNGLEGVDNSTSYLDTTGTIAGVAVLIGIVILAFGVMARR